MAVKLRLRRMGRKKKPYYRIIAADSRSPRDGRFIEEIGVYNPISEPATIEVKQDRALYWLSQGAIPTETVNSLFRKTGINLRFDLKKRGVAEEKAVEEIAQWEAMQEARKKRLESKKLADQQKLARQEKEKAEAEAKVAEPEAPAESTAADAVDSAEENADA